MVQRWLSTSKAKEYLKSGDLLATILCISADIEFLFFDKLFFEKNINPELMDRWTLGNFIRWNIKSGLIDKKYNKMLKNFRDLRNNCVHRRYYLDNLKENKQQLTDIQDLLKRVMNFIDSTKVVYELDSEKERVYGKIKNH